MRVASAAITRMAFATSTGARRLRQPWAMASAPPAATAGDGIRTTCDGRGRWHPRHLRQPRAMASRPPAATAGDGIHAACGIRGACGGRAQ